MPALREHVQLERNLMVAQSLAKGQRIFDVDAAVLRGMPEENGRRFVGDVLRKAEIFLVLLIAIAQKVFSASDVSDALTDRDDGIAENGAVGVAIQLVDRIGWLISVGEEEIEAQRCPPAEKPQVTMRLGSTLHSAAFARTVRTAR